MTINTPSPSAGWQPYANVQTVLNTSQQPPLPQSLPRTGYGGEGWGEGEEFGYIPPQFPQGKLRKPGTDR